ncbi:MAG TPA: hypothetical protein VLV17_07260 [Anaeromyxobacteraceae bacterium]|nr:hypothetical protein [Anaeromyxobacteraceae bacterium]
MTGTVKHMLDTIIAVRGKGNPTFVEATRAKLILKGLNPVKFTASTVDDPAIVARVRTVATEFGVNL